jgi:hypothetical protein
LPKEVVTLALRYWKFEQATILLYMAKLQTLSIFAFYIDLPSILKEASPNL